MLDAEIDAIENKIGYCFSNKELLSEAFFASIAESEYYEESDTPSPSSNLIYLSHSAIDSATVSFLAQIYGVSYEYFSFSREIRFIDELRLELEDRGLYSDRIDKLGLDKFMYKHKKLYSKAENKELKADLFEAIIGAIVVDSGYNMQAISKAYTKMLDPMEYILTRDGIDYLAEITAWMDAKYDSPLDFDIYHSANRYEAILRIPNQNDLELYHEMDLAYSDMEMVNGYGFTEEQAKRDACRRCFNYLKANNKLDYSILTKDVAKIREIVSSRSEAMAGEIITRLVEEGLLSRPSFEYSYDNYAHLNNCAITVSEYSYAFLGEAKTKKRAKKLAYKQLVTQIYNDVNNKKHRVDRVELDSDEDLPF